MAKTKKPAKWNFRNSKGHLIRTNDAGTAEKYRHSPHFEEVLEESTEPTEPTGGNEPGYDRWRKADLEKEIERRNADRAEDDQLPGTGTVAELAAALTADDAATK